MTRSFQKINGKSWQWNYTYDNQNRLTQRSDGTGQHQYNRGWSSGGGLSSMSATGQGVRFERAAAESLAVRREFGDVGQEWTIRRTITRAHSDSTVDYPERAALNAAFGVAFRFDSLSRLMNQKYNGTYMRRFNYDANGRLTGSCTMSAFGCKDEWGAVSYGYRYDAAGNRLLGAEPLTNILPGNRVGLTHGWYFKYDANGNVISKCTDPLSQCQSQGFLYTWDALGRLKKVTDESYSLIDSMGYDAFGRRVRKTTASGTEWYVYDGTHVAFDVNNSNAIKNEYGYYPGTDAIFTLKNPNWTGIALTDPRIGSVIGWADTLGNMKKQYDIKAWGRVSADTGVLTRHRMAGREYDQESGLYYMRARYYDPETGRFLSEDPIGIAGGLNLYAYSGNDPVNNRDPSGTDYYCYREVLLFGTYQNGQLTDLRLQSASGPICMGSISLPSSGGPSGGGSSGGVKGGGHAGGGGGSKGEETDPCYEKHKLSAAMSRLSGNDKVGDVIEVVEVGSLLSVGTDIVAMNAKAARIGAGGLSTPYASGFNMIGRPVARAMGRSTATRGMLVGGVVKFGNKFTLAGLVTTVGSAAYNLTTFVQCRLGTID